MTQAAATASTFDSQPRRRPGAIARERVIEAGLLLAAISSILVTSGIVFILVSESVPFFRKVSLREFLTGGEWSPMFADPHFGILPLVCGTLLTTLVALAVAMPVGTVIAIWLSEFAHARVRELVKPLLEMLAAVPTVVYGYFAITLVSPALQRVLQRFFEDDIATFNVLSAGSVMGLMIVPYVCSLSEDAMRAVPMLLREGSYGMGANRTTTAVRVVFPAALSGIAAAYTLAISRAVGETMIVAIAAGMQPNLPEIHLLAPKASFQDALLSPTETISAFIVQVSQGDLPHGTIGYQSIFAAGMTLFVMTLGFNLLGAALRRRYRQGY